MRSVFSVASATPETSDAATLSAIDELLERHLHLLDEHQKLQEDIKKQFSAGFFSLACANRSSPPGRRYGEDYDERMKAARRVVTKSNESSLPNTELCNLACKNHAPNRFAIVQDKSGESENDGTSEIRDVNHSQNNDAADEDNLPPKTNLKPTSLNPLHWFGILVPAGLRDAQRSFASVVDGPIPALANVITEMREVEQKVDDLRKVLKLGQNSLA